MWSNNPLSIYANALYTIIDGTIYFDRDHDLQLRKQIAAERNRLTQKMIAEGRTNPGSTTAARPSLKVILHCEDDYDHQKGILETDSYDDLINQNQ